MKNEVIYVPRAYAQSVTRIKEIASNQSLNLKYSSYSTILALASFGEVLGLVTREYVNKEDYKKYNLIEVKTSVNLGRIEFGIYLNSSRSEDLNNLVKLIKAKFEI